MVGTSAINNHMTITRLPCRNLQGNPVVSYCGVLGRAHQRGAKARIDGSFWKSWGGVDRVSRSINRTDPSKDSGRYLIAAVFLTCRPRVHHVRVLLRPPIHNAPNHEAYD